MQKGRCNSMDAFRRDFIKLATTGLAGAVGSAVAITGARADVMSPVPAAGTSSVYDVQRFGATGDGKTIDSGAINKAIDAAAAAGGGTVRFPAGVYASYSIRLKSNIALYLEQGATILGASTALEGTTDGYDPAESNSPWESYQDYGHNHWHNSLIWAEGIHNVAILGPGLIWGKGLSRGTSDKDRPRAEKPGAGNKSIALKNCFNVILRDFSILEGGHFGILATGVDNLTIDNLKIDTNRDGMDIDCCRNVRVSNCSVNSPWDDGICPKSSFALGYARATENVTITNCYVTGGYQLGAMLDGTFKRWGPESKWFRRVVSNAEPSRTVGSKTLRSPTASSRAAGVLRWNRSMERCWRTLRSLALPCAIFAMHRCSCVWAHGCGDRREFRWGR